VTLIQTAITVSATTWSMKGANP